MGRLAHILRVALGRSYDLPPNWEELHDQYEDVEGDRILYVGKDPSRSDSCGKTFNDKGRPTDKESDDLEREQEKAQNAALAIALSTSAETPIDLRPDLRLTTKSSVDNNLKISAEQQAAADAISSADQIAKTLEDHIRLVVTWPFSSVAARCLIYKSTDYVHLLQRISTETQYLGILATTYPGFVCGYVAFGINILRGKAHSQLLMLRTFWDIPSALWSFSYALWIGSSLSVFCLIHYANLQALHLIPCNCYMPRKIPFSLLFSSELYRAGVFSNPLVSFIGSAVARLFLYDPQITGMPDPTHPAHTDHESKPPIVGWAKRLARQVQSALGRGATKLMWFAISPPLDHKYFTRYPISSTRRTIVNILSRTLLFPFQDFILRTIARTFLNSAQTPTQIGNAQWFSQLIFPTTLGSYAFGSSVTGGSSATAYLRRLSICFCLWTSAELLVLSAQNQIWLWRYRAKAIR